MLNCNIVLSRQRGGGRAALDKKRRRCGMTSIARRENSAYIQVFLSSHAFLALRRGRNRRPRLYLFSDNERVEVDGPALRSAICYGQFILCDETYGGYLMRLRKLLLYCDLLRSSQRQLQRIIILATTSTPYHL